MNANHAHYAYVNQVCFEDMIRGVLIDSMSAETMRALELAPDVKDDLGGHGASRPD